ncbi:MAG: DUF3524 domain-containing protein, partial [Sinomicrobium sp.]|nr:DUF3524 domain-containing protein [Sinomicrobium sp.]
MQILLIEPFFSGSHRQWAMGFQRHSRHRVEILSLPGRHWKRRMYDGAVSLARQFLRSDTRPDLILATDMLDLATFLSLTRSRLQQTPVALYFHENQITYPWSPTDQDPKLRRNNQYGFLNYTSALCADRIFFNSAFHRNSFFSALPAFLKQFPDHRELDLISGLKAKSQVLLLGLDLQTLLQPQPAQRPTEPVILWNHRWEYDKDPALFFRTLQQVRDHGQAFKLIVLGKAYKKSPEAFAWAKQELGAELLHFGYVTDRTEYARWLHLADILPVTSRQDFFGASAVEAIYCQCYPLLPDRLAFPEHIPTGKHEQHIYRNDEDLLNM